MTADAIRKVCGQMTFGEHDLPERYADTTLFGGAGVRPEAHLSEPGYVALVKHVSAHHTCPWRKVAIEFLREAVTRSPA